MKHRTIFVLAATLLAFSALQADTNNRSNDMNYKINFKKPDLQGNFITCSFDVELEFGDGIDNYYRTGQFYVSTKWQLDSSSLRPGVSGLAKPFRRWLNTSFTNNSADSKVLISGFSVRMGKEYLNDVLKPGTHNITVNAIVRGHNSKKKSRTYTVTIAYHNDRTSGKTASGGFSMKYWGVNIDIPGPANFDSRQVEGKGTITIGNSFSYTGDFRVYISNPGGVSHIVSTAKGTGRWHWYNFQVIDFQWSFSAWENKLDLRKAIISFNTGVPHSIDGSFTIDFEKEIITTSRPGDISINNLPFKLLSGSPQKVRFYNGDDPVEELYMYYSSDGFGVCIPGLKKKSQYKTFLQQGFKRVADDCQ